MPNTDSRRAQPGTRLRDFRTPRYWPAWFLCALLWAIAKLPFGIQLGLGRALGRAFGLIASRRKRHIVARNLELCFPELEHEARTTLQARHCEALGTMFVEMAIGWFTPIEQLRARFEVQGREHLDAARATGRGIILLGAHFTPLETGFAITAELCGGISCVYHAPANAAMDALLRCGRQHFVKRQIPRDDIRGLLRHLKAGAIVAYFPDQTYTGNQGTLLPFFGIPAITNIATPKIARLANAIVLPYFFQRLPGTDGYRVTILAPLEALPDEDDTAWTRRWVQLLETQIRLAPEQYLWTYKKFKGRPAPLPDLYAVSRVP